jgi:hypothetical protein
MKRIVASFSAMALGATAIQSLQAQDLGSQTGDKPWSVSVALRGFYDDNYLAAPRDSNLVRDSFGFDIRPSVALGLSSEQTYFGVGYTFNGRYYEDSERRDDPWDLSHFANLEFNHKFSQRVALEVSDNLTISDQPELVDPNFATFRTDSSALNNRAAASVSVGVTPIMGFVVGYQNNYWDYENENPAAENTPPVFSSLSARLDRFEHLIPVQLRFQAAPPTVVFGAYNFGMYDYTSDEYLYAYPPALGLGAGPKADTRNNRSHYGYVGVEHNFTPVMSMSAAGGVQYSDFYNDDLSDNSLTPYGDISFTYLYTAGSSARIGYTLSQQATDVLDPAANGQVTQNRLASSLYGRVTHQFLPQLKGSLFAQWQLSQYNGGAVDNDTENLYLFGASVRYDFNRFLSADLGYAFDYLDSDIPSRGGGYTRNRVYLGVTAKY